MKPTDFPRPDWSPLPAHAERFGVEGQVLLMDERLLVARLRFAENAQTDVHPADHDIHVLCLEGQGYSFCGGETVPIHEGQSVLWPRGEPHNLFTREHTMTTLMLEHVHQRGR